MPAGLVGDRLPDLQLSRNIFEVPVHGLISW